MGNEELKETGKKQSYSREYRYDHERDSWVDKNQEKLFSQRMNNLLSPCPEDKGVAGILQRVRSL